MTRLFLTAPSLAWKEEILSYKTAFSNEHLHGGAGLAKIDTIEDWIKHLEAAETAETCGEGRVPSTTFLCIRESDQKMIGICNIRHSIDLDYLFNIAGHIGYSIHPDERRKGYAKEQLRLALLESQKLGLHRALITAADWNIGSQKTILANGGILENQFYDEKDQEWMNRYWIDL